jgi:hypothetical protein
MEEPSGLLILLHSILRWLILISVAIAGFVALAGYLRKGPIIVWERSIAILAMVLCHVQLLLGLVLYAMRFRSYSLLTNQGKATAYTSTVVRFWKYEHIAMMILAIALVTLGRVLSKKATTERGKQLRVAIFYLIALVLMIAVIPWPFREVVGRAWL